MSDKFKRFIPKGKVIRLKNNEGVEETFEIRKPQFKHMKDLLFFSKKFQGMDNENQQEILNRMDKETLERMNSFCLGVMVDNYPTEKKEDLEAFVQYNCQELFTEIMNLMQ